MGLFRDRLEEKSQTASYARKVAKMSGRHPAGKSAPAPHTCGQRCRPGYTCTSTVRGGVCPCSDC